MPDVSRKHPLNADGPWFVDLGCISCDTCTDISPDVFARDADRKAYVRAYAPEHASLFQFAVESCPVEAVGTTEPDSA
jgi:ferredoxin